MHSFLSTGNIYDKTLETVQALGLDSECVGGGRIKHDAAAKKILVYGYSQVKFSQRNYSRRAGE
jgi:phosphohistidine phosphatase